MKTKKINLGISLIMAFAFLFISYNLTAQYNYQAVLRDGNGDLVTNQAIGMKITITEYVTFPTTSSTIRYVETQTATTNDNGLLSIVVGDGTTISGTLSDVRWDGYNIVMGMPISWHNNIKVEYDLTGGTNYTLTTDEIIHSVPKATYASKAGSANSAHNGAIAYGIIDDDGTILKAKGVESVTWNNSLKRYRVTLTGITYLYSNFATVATPTTGTGPKIVNVSSQGGDLLIYIYNLSGSKIQSAFNFATFDPSN